MGRQERKERGDRQRELAKGTKIKEWIWWGEVE